MTAAGVTLRLTGGMPFAGRVHLLLSAPARPELTGLIRSMTARSPLACPVTVLPSSAPDRTIRVHGRENAVPMLAELVELVIEPAIGVDAHTDTHTAALVAVDTGALLTTITVTADADGYAQLVELAETHGRLRAWAIEGAGGYGAGLARHLAAHAELVVELDQPERPAPRAGLHFCPAAP